jgi:uncharacterized repeat protein (TIGR03847 family)
VSESIDFDPVDWITASSIGPPGDRVFYLQARKAKRYVSFVVEKAQIRSLAETAQELLARFGVVVTPDHVNSDLELHGPVNPLWRAGQMGLGSDDEGEMFIMEALELAAEPNDEPPATARFVINREQMIGLAAFAAFAVEHGGRERCQVCEGLRDPMSGCMGCPLTNGSGPKRI